LAEVAGVVGAVEAGPVALPPGITFRVEDAFLHPAQHSSIIAAQTIDSTVIRMAALLFR